MMDSGLRVASALCKSLTPGPELAGEAVRQAMDKAGLEVANAVLLFLSSDFSRDPQPAVTAAARAANCLQVTGCSCAGLFTEEEWVLDAPAAAALVLGGPIGLRSTPEGPDDWLLTLAAPNAVDTSWLAGPGRRFGAVAGDATGRGPYTVWSGGRVLSSGRCELALAGGTLRVGISQGVNPISPPQEITRVSGHDVQAIDGQPALASLARGLPVDMGASRQFPLHLVMAGVTYGDPENALAEGRYHLLPVLSANAEDRSVTVSARLEAGEKLFWAIRQPLAAERDMRLTLDRMTEGTQGDPRFGLCFPCVGRGPYFYGNTDRDLEQLTSRFPGMPLIGFYGNGEFAHLDQRNRLVQYSTVTALYYDRLPRVQSQS